MLLVVDNVCCDLKSPCAHVVIFVKNYSEIEEYHKLKYHLDYFHTNWDNNSDISCEWIAFEYIDGGDSKDCVEYYRVYDILKDVSEFKELIRR